MTKSRLPAIAFSALLTLGIVLAACSFSLRSASNGTAGSGSSSSTSSSTSSGSQSPAGTVMTPNVSYRGVLEVLGASVYQQGTHKLTLDDGQMIVLESTDANLNLGKYVGKRVEVQGSVQPTVEAGGTMMRVTEVTVLESSSSSDTVLSASSSSSASKKTCGGIAALPCGAGQVCIDDPSDSCDPQHGGADCSGICVDVLSSSSVSSKASVSSVASSPKASSSASFVSSSTASSVASAVNADMEQQIKLMMKQSYDQSGLWTQKYCTSHIAFCIPVHKNWYFKSFGATTSNMWHVEFGMSNIDALGQGAIVLNLISGSSASMSARDGQIKAQGSDVIGFKDWKDGNHFELIADSRLRAAVEYMLSGISAYELAQ